MPTNDIVVPNGNVLLVDPNLVNVNLDVSNPIPPYQDMYIFAELVAKSKGRTLIIDGNTNSTASKTINFIGNNQDDETLNNPNYLNFTTNYYDGSSPDGKYYESFGIENIKIVTNSSFVPQVSIRFVDVRGLSFFNQYDSPYRILFDFPPPTFTLTVKGQYGKPVVYDLHLVKYTSEFNAGNGNFIIEAQFVAQTFAPLSDILFRYVVNTALIDANISMNPEGDGKPRNTFELILKLKNLYKAISEKLETDSESVEYNNALKGIEKIDETLSIIASFQDNQILTEQGTPYLITRTPSRNDYVTYPPVNSLDSDKITQIFNLSEYDNLIKEELSSGKPSTPKNRLYIVYEIATNVVAPTTPAEYQFTPSYFEYDTENTAGPDAALKKYKQLLLNQVIPTVVFEENDIVDPKQFVNSYDIQLQKKSTNTKYYGIDISNYYYKIYKQKASLIESRTTLAENVIKKINNMVEQRLGMLPSVYNVFEIILNDVDLFFTKLKQASDSAFDSHNNSTNKQIILGDGAYKDNTEDVYSFPLVIKTLSDREERVAPIELAKKVPFPELDFVEDFIDTFPLQEKYRSQLDVRNDQNDQGNYIWIPISPFDSTLGSASPESPYVDINDNIKTGILRTLLNRFYMLSQGFYSDAFYSENTLESNTRSKVYVDLFSNSEAINLSQGANSDIVIGVLKTMTDRYMNDIQNFYADVSGITDTYNNGTTNVTGNLYSFPTNDPKYFTISSDGQVYTNKFNSGFKGFNLDDNPIQLREAKENSSAPIDIFFKNLRISWSLRKLIENNFEVASQNIFYVADKSDRRNATHIVDNENGEIQLNSRYIVDKYYQDDGYFYPDTNNNLTGVLNTDFQHYYPGTISTFHRIDNLNERQMIAYNQGNEAFQYYTDSFDATSDVTSLWSRVLADYDELLINTITGTTTRDISSVILLSNFGYTASPFNKFPNNFNDNIFTLPSAIEVPYFLVLYMGALVSATSDTNNWEQRIIDFFTTKPGALLNNAGFFVLADLHDVSNYLSEQDRQTFLSEYNSFMTNQYDNIVSQVINLYNQVRKSTVDRFKTYKYYLNPNEKANVKISNGGGAVGGYFNGILRPFLNRINIINYNQLTFKRSLTYSTGYASLKTVNADPSFKNVHKVTNDKYFTQLFSKLQSLLSLMETEAKEEREQLEKMKGDPDIINQLYYSFKNINDKWLTGTAKGKPNYPFVFGEKKLIDLFAFVDRGMNPIGETIINCEILADMLDDNNISLYSVLSQLLSLNGFEFFPLQNFLGFGDDVSWMESFKIHTSGYNDSQRTYFVCMYIGGTSSYPSVSANGFVEDGIIDISTPGVKGFSPTKDSSQFEENINQEKNNFPFREVRAFRVRFGEQNQSMFKDIKIDSKEYPETNESIQILSRLAGDGNPNVPAPKGQNLYNLYENRSYKATVSGFGNMMIQPTQYFQIENVPLFNGAYVILNVEHNITPNNMQTTFSGTKLLKYPVPRVTTPFAFANMDDMTGGEATTYALKTASQATNISDERLDNLDSIKGIDVSHWNGQINWKEAKADGIQFTFIKLTQGPTWYDGNANKYDIIKNINNAISNDITVSYYHFAHLGETASPSNDGVTNANNFLNRLNGLISQGIPKPTLPIVLDIEWDCFVENRKDPKPYLWSNKNTDINTFITSFITTMKNSGYEVIIYSATAFLNQYKINLFGNYPLWVARYYTLGSGKSNPETNEPSVPTEWKNGWTIWQFTSQGIVNGTNGSVDINVMKSDFFKKYV